MGCRGETNEGPQKDTLPGGHSVSSTPGEERQATGDNLTSFQAPLSHHSLDLCQGVFVLVRVSVSTLRALSGVPESMKLMV